MKRWHELLLTSLSVVIVAILLMMLTGGVALAAEDAPITTFHQLQQYHDLDRRYPEATELFERTLTTRIENANANYYVTYALRSSSTDKTRVRLSTGFDYAVDARYGRDVGELSHTEVSYHGFTNAGELVIRYLPDNEVEATDVMLLSFDGAIYHYSHANPDKKYEYLGTIDLLQAGPSFMYTYIEVEGATLYSEYPTSQFVFHHTSMEDLYHLGTLNVKFNDETDVVRDSSEIARRERPTYEEYIKLLDILIKKEANPSRTYAEILLESGYARYDENAVYPSYDDDELITMFIDRLTDEMHGINEMYGGPYADFGWEYGDTFQLQDVGVRMTIPGGTEVLPCSDVEIMATNKTGDMISFLSTLGFNGYNRDLFVDLLIGQDANDFMLLGIKNLGLSAERLREYTYEMQRLSGVTLVEDAFIWGQGIMKVHSSERGESFAVYIIPREDGMYILAGPEKYIEEKILLRNVSPTSLDASLYSGTAWERAYALFLLSGEYLHTADYYPDVSNDYAPIAYALEDMDADGIPELVIYCGSDFHAGECAYVYRYEESVRYMNMVPGGGLDDGPICASANRNYPGLLTFNGGMGCFETDYHTILHGEGWYVERVSEEEWVWLGDDAGETTVVTRITEDDGLYQASQDQIRLPFFSLGELKEMFAEWAGSSRRVAQPYLPGRRQEDQGAIPSSGYAISITYVPEDDMTFYERVYDDGFRMSISEQGYRVERARGYVDYATWGRGPSTVDKLDYALLAAVPNMSGQEAWAHLIDNFPDTCPIFQGGSFAIRNISGLDYCVFEVDERHAIVAFGGTKGDELSDIKADAQILLGIAVNQASIAREIINALPYDKVIVTGHSLGGYVAVDTALFCSKVVECVVFDAPGRGGSVGENTYMENWNSKVVNYVESGDEIHSIGQHPGEVIEVAVGSNAIENMFGQHDIRNFIDAWTQ